MHSIRARRLPGGASGWMVWLVRAMEDAATAGPIAAPVCLLWATARVIAVLLRCKAALLLASIKWAAFRPGKPSRMSAVLRPFPAQSVCRPPGVEVARQRNCQSPHAPVRRRGTYLPS